MKAEEMNLKSMESETKEQKPLTEKERAQRLREISAYKKNLKEQNEILELEVKWLQLSLAKPRLEMEFYKMNNPDQFKKDDEAVITPE